MSENKGLCTRAMDLYVGKHINLKTYIGHYDYYCLPCSCCLCIIFMSGITVIYSTAVKAINKQWNFKLFHCLAYQIHMFKHTGSETFYNKKCNNYARF